MTKSVNNSVKEKPATALTTPPSLKRNLSEMCNTAEMYRHVNNREGFYFSRSGCSGETPTITIVEEFDTPMKRNKELKMVKKVVSFGYKLGGSDSVVYSNLVAVNDCMVVFKNKSPDGDHTSTKYAVNWLQAGLPRHVQKLLKEMIELQLDIDADINPDSQTSMEEGWLVLNAALSTDPPAGVRVTSKGSLAVDISREENRLYKHPKDWVVHLPGKYLAHLVIEIKLHAIYPAGKPSPPHGTKYNMSFVIHGIKLPSVKPIEVIDISDMAGCAVCNESYRGQDLVWNLIPSTLPYMGEVQTKAQHLLPNTVFVDNVWPREMCDRYTTRINTPDGNEYRIYRTTGSNNSHDGKIKAFAVLTNLMVDLDLSSRINRLKSRGLDDWLMVTMSEDGYYYHLNPRWCRIIWGWGHNNGINLLTCGPCHYTLSNSPEPPSGSLALNYMENDTYSPYWSGYWSRRRSKRDMEASYLLMRDLLMVRGSMCGQTLKAHSQHDCSKRTCSIASKVWCPISVTRSLRASYAIPHGLKISGVALLSSKDLHMVQATTIARGFEQLQLTLNETVAEEIWGKDSYLHFVHKWRCCLKENLLYFYNSLDDGNKRKVVSYIRRKGLGCRPVEDV